MEQRDYYPVGKSAQVLPAKMKTEHKKKEESSLEIEKSSRKCPAKKNEVTEKVLTRLQPDPEQLRIARILDNAKKEDPKLEEKLKQVVEATQKSVDEAHVALHDSDYDPNKAVDLLLEGKVIVEWATSSKKKRIKTPSSTTTANNNKSANVKQERPNKSVEAPQDDNLEAPVLSKPVLGNRGYRGRGRGGYQYGRNVSNSVTEPPAGKVKVFTNSTLEDEIPDIIETKYFERARMPVIRPVDTWDPSRPVSNLLNKGSRNDFEEEEYTGSLAKGLVITSSCFGKQVSSCEVSNTIGNNALKTNPEAIETPLDLPKEDIPKSINTPSQNSNINIPSPTSDTSHEAMNESVTKPTLGTKAPPITASIINVPPRTEKASPKVLPRTPSRSKSVSRSKIPAKAVVMPPDDDNIRPLDVTFGAVDLSDKDECSSAVNEPPLEISCQKRPSEKTLTPKLDSGNHKEIKDDKFNLMKEVKVDSNFYDSPLNQNSFCKTNPKSLNIHNPAFPCEAILTTSNIYSSSIPSTYSSPPGIPGTNSSTCPHVHYNSFGGQVSQSLPPAHNVSNQYHQNVLGSQTYTSNSQYGTSVLPSSLPYQSYSSMVQGQKPPVTSHFSKELEGGANANLNSLTYSGTALSGSTSNTPTSKNNNLGPPHGKNMLSNMHTLVSPHQIILSQGGIPYIQPPLYYQDMHLVPPQRLPAHLNAGYYDVNYPASPPARDGSSYHINDKVFMRPDGSLLQSHQAGTSSNEQQTNIVYRDCIGGQYSGVCMGGNDGPPRMDGYKPIQMPLTQPVLSPVKPVTSASNINSYD